MQLNSALFGYVTEKAAKLGAVQIPFFFLKVRLNKCTTESSSDLNLQTYVLFFFFFLQELGRYGYPGRGHYKQLLMIFYEAYSSVLTSNQTHVHSVCVYT